jgi:hypothetical protein
MLSTSFVYKGVHVTMNEVPELLSFIGQNRHFTAMISISEYSIGYHCQSIGEFKNYMMDFIDKYFDGMEKFLKNYGI